MAIKGILFDKDGTIIDFYEVWGNAANIVMDKIFRDYHIESDKTRHSLRRALGLDLTGKISPDGALAYKTYEQIAEALWIEMKEIEDTPSIQELCQKLKENFCREVAEKRTSYPCFTDMGQLMKEVKELKLYVGLATADEYEAAKLCMKKIGIHEEISFYGAAGLGYPAKPQKDMIDIAAKQWGILPEEIAVVGDTPNDMQFALNGNAYGIGVLSGISTKEDLEPLAREIIPSLGELAAVIKRLNCKI